MLRSIFGKAMWVGRTVSAVMGLMIVLALLVLIVDSAASAANGKPFLLGKKNVATAVSKLVGKVAGPSLLINNASANSKATALQLNVKAGKPPMKVNSTRKVARLNADKLDNLDQSAFLRKNGKAVDSDKLDGKDESAFLGKTEKAANADKVDDLDSTALLPGGDLPSGRTLRGSYDIRDYVPPSSFGLDSSAISFGYRLASSPTVRLIKAGKAAPAECPGTAFSPEANPGYLCVYETGANNLDSNSYPSASNITRNGANLHAFSTYNASSNTTSFYAHGTWAVTGN